MTMTLRQYPTKPIACWDKMKDFRRAHHIRNNKAMDTGGTIAVGIIEEFQPILAGFGPYAAWQYEPRFTRIMRSNEENLASLEALEHRGFPVDLCNSLKVHLGGVYRGHLQEALKGKKPDLIFQWELCPYTMKVVQAVSEHLGGVPVVAIDLNPRYSGKAPDLQYMVDQLANAIEDIYKITGKTFDDERFIEAVTMDWENSALWAKICMLNQNRPAPLDHRMLQSLRIPLILDRDRPDVLAFYKELYEEIKERVAQGISARGYEEARLLWHRFVPFTPDSQRALLHYPEVYGAVLVGGDQPFQTFGVWDVVPPRRTWIPAKTPRERGKEIRTREQGLYYLAERYMGSAESLRPGAVATRGSEVIAMAEDWKCNGVIMGLERRCRPTYLGGMARLAAVQRSGMPALELEPGSADPREQNVAACQKSLDAFLQGLGLRPVPKEKAVDSKEDADNE